MNINQRAIEKNKNLLCSNSSESSDCLNESIVNNNMNDEELVDIRTVSVDKSLSKEERIKEFVRQVKNPYRFKCGKFVVNTRYTENGPTLEDCLRRIAMA